MAKELLLESKLQKRTGSQQPTCWQQRLGNSEQCPLPPVAGLLGDCSHEMHGNVTKRKFPELLFNDLHT